MAQQKNRLFSWGFGRSTELPTGMYVSELQGLSLPRLREMFENATEERTGLGSRKDLLPRMPNGVLDFRESTVFPTRWGVCVQNGRLYGVTWNEVLQHLTLEEIRTLLTRAVEANEADMSRLVRPTGRGVYFPLDEPSQAVERGIVARS